MTFGSERWGVLSWGVSEWSSGRWGTSGIYDFLWEWVDSLDADKGDMVGTILRDSAATYIDADGVLQWADGDDTPFSHASIEDETGATEMRGSFVDGQAWFHDAGGLIAAYAGTGNLLIIDDTAANGYGYIGEVGTGEVATALPNNVTGITKANPGVVTSVAHDLSIGSLVKFDSLTEMTELNNAYMVVTAVGTADTFSINDTSGYGAAETTGGACGHEVTEPAVTAVKIYKEHTLVNEGWNALDADLDYNAITAFDVYQNKLFEYPDLYTGWDFTSGWSNIGVGITIDDSNSFSSTNAGGAGISASGAGLLLTVGQQYKLEVAGSTTSISYSVYNSDGGGGSRIEIGGNGTYTFTATQVSLYIRSVGIGTTDITTFKVAQTVGGAEPRFEANGVLNEGGESTNYCLQSNDMTEGVWTATNITPLKDVTGVDGIANSASRLTATAGNGTILQSINTLASATHCYSPWLKRISGTGTIELTDDNGANWTAKTLTSDWQRFSVTRSQTDPIVGIRIVTSGDVIAAQFNQVEASQAYYTSSIPTIAIPVTRTADYQTWVNSASFITMLSSGNPFTMAVEITPKFSYGDTIANANIISVLEDESLFYTNEDGNFVSSDDGGADESIVDPNYVSGTTYIFVLRVFLDGTMKYEVGEKHGGTWSWDATPAAYDGSFNPSTDLIIGYLNQYPFNLKNLKFWKSAKSRAYLTNKYSAVAE